MSTPERTSTQDPIAAAVEVLYESRHSLPPDVLRSLAAIWTCASAASYGKPYEEFWVGIDAELAAHDIEECENGDPDDEVMVMCACCENPFRPLPSDRWDICSACLAVPTP